jgi:hypothetical protein
VRTAQDRSNNSNFKQSNIRTDIYIEASVAIGSAASMRAGRSQMASAGS